MRTASAWCMGLLVSGGLSAQTQAAMKGIPKFELAVACIKKYEGLHNHRHYPYYGYGHKRLPGEKLSYRMTEREADALLRKDLRKLCATFRCLGKDSLLVATLAYNVGIGTLLGNGKRKRSRLIAKLKAGDRRIYAEYISFRKWKGRVVRSIERRRKMEFLLLYEP